MDELPCIVKGIQQRFYFFFFISTASNTKSREKTSALLDRHLMNLSLSNEVKLSTAERSYILLHHLYAPSDEHRFKGSSQDNIPEIMCYAAQRRCE